MEMPHRRRVRLVTLVAVALGVATSCSQSTVHTRSDTVERPDSALAVASFDTVWRLIRDTHYDTSLKGLDWNAIGAELRPKVAAARTVDEVRSTLGELVSRLGDSHYGIIPAEAVAVTDTGQPVGEYGDLGFDVRLVDGQFLVSRVDPDGAARAAGLAPGWVVVRVDSFDVAPLLDGVRRTTGRFERRLAGIHASLALARRLGGVHGSVAWVTVRNGADRQLQLAIRRGGVPGEIVRFGALPPILARLQTERFHDAGGCIGVVRFTTWMPVVAPQLERAVRELRSCRGIALDLRGNLGGVAAMVMGTSGWFLDTPDTLGILRTRKSELRYVAIPQHVYSDGATAPTYRGALALLVDAQTASTSEIFAAGLRDAGRARVFGDTTAGQALPATLYRLPDGDVLMYAIADFTTRTGMRLDRRGVIPDEVVPLRRTDLLAGRDLALDAALRWIRAERGRVSSP